MKFDITATRLLCRLVTVLQVEGVIVKFEPEVDPVENNSSCTLALLQSEVRTALGGGEWGSENKCTRPPHKDNPCV